MKLIYIILFLLSLMSVRADVPIRDTFIFYNKPQIDRVKREKYNSILESTFIDLNGDEVLSCHKLLSLLNAKIEKEGLVVNIMFSTKKGKEWWKDFPVEKIDIFKNKQRKEIVEYFRELNGKEIIQFIRLHYSLYGLFYFNNEIILSSDTYTPT